MRKRVLILKEPTTTIKVEDTHLEIKNILNNLIISFAHVESVYISKTIKVDIGVCYKISQKVPLFIIDQNGYILAELKRMTNA